MHSFALISLTSFPVLDDRDKPAAADITASVLSVLSHRLPHIKKRESEAVKILLESAFSKSLGVVKSTLNENPRSEMVCYALPLWGVFSFGFEGHQKFPEFVEHVVDLLNVYVECLLASRGVLVSDLCLLSGRMCLGAGNCCFFSLCAQTRRLATLLLCLL